jgi:hypothetical protein
MYEGNFFIGNINCTMVICSSKTKIAIVALKGGNRFKNNRGQIYVPTN